MYTVVVSVFVAVSHVVDCMSVVVWVRLAADAFLLSCGVAFVAFISLGLYGGRGLFYTGGARATDSTCRFAGVWVRFHVATTFCCY